MNHRNIKYILILVLVFSFSCQIDQKLDGYYSNCNNGEYIEIYFKRDSIRVASENDWVKLSEWRKIKIIDDTLFFETFGEWKDSRKAKIEYIGRKKVELKFPKHFDDTEFNVIQNLKRIGDDFDINESEEFWTKFRKRQISADCKTLTEKNVD